MCTDMVKRKGPQGVVVRSTPPQEFDESASGVRKKKKRAKHAPGASGTEPQEAVDGVTESLSSAGAVIEAEAGVDAPVCPGIGGPPSKLLDWLVWPLTSTTFLEKYWEKRPVHIRRKRPGFWGELFSKAVVDEQLRGKAPPKYGERINLARFDTATGRKVSLNKEGAACCEEVDSAWANGASIQVMHPQQFHQPVRRLLLGLERSFGALCGANSYITPGSCQGLAPHFDDVEVFMMQLEGSKRWRLHEPPSGEEFPVPRDYSRDFMPDELESLLLDSVIESGDLLYVPRGVVHQGVACSSGFSHHLTVSTYQKTAWCNVDFWIEPSQVLWSVLLLHARSFAADFRWVS